MIEEQHGALVSFGQSRATWLYTGDEWQQAQHTQTELGRSLHSTTYDANRGRVFVFPTLSHALAYDLVLFGGASDNGRLADTWSFAYLSEDRDENYTNTVDDDGDALLDRDDDDCRW